MSDPLIIIRLERERMRERGRKIFLKIELRTKIGPSLCEDPLMIRDRFF